MKIFRNMFMPPSIYGTIKAATGAIYSSKTYRSPLGEIYLSPSGATYNQP